MNIDWIEIPGGTCLFGDQARRVVVPTLLWTRTPIPQGHLSDGPTAHRPLACVDQPAAEEFARQLGGRLPRSVEWEWMAAGAERRVWPWGDTPWNPALANLRDSTYDGTTDVTAHADGGTPDGMLDVAGNVWEWTVSPTLGDGFVLRGGSYASPPLYARCTFLNSAPAELRSPGIGFRVVREL